MIELIASILIGYIALRLGFASLRVLRNTKSIKLRAKKLMFTTAILLSCAVTAYMRGKFYADALTPVKSYDEVSLMNSKFDKIDSYLFYDYAGNVAYNVPNPLPECPFTIDKIDENNEVSKLEILSYEDLPVLLDTVWYWYGTQTGEDYQMFTMGNILSPYEGEQQTFVTTDTSGVVQNIYTVMFPVEEELSIEDVWLVVFYVCVFGVLLDFVSTVVCTVYAVKEKRKGGK